MSERVALKIQFHSSSFVFRPKESYVGQDGGGMKRDKGVNEMENFVIFVNKNISILEAKLGLDRRKATCSVLNQRSKL